MRISISAQLSSVFDNGCICLVELDAFLEIADAGAGQIGRSLVIVDEEARWNPDYLEKLSAEPRRAFKRFPPVAQSRAN
jgi:hypothetical protein